MIDQLCVPQKDDLLRETLLSIPMFYKSFHVVVLLPGVHCKCLSDSFSNFIHSQDGDVYKLASAATLVSKAVKGMHCPRSNGSCSWGSRIWTSQELRYSRSLVIVWAEEVADFCPTPNVMICAREVRTVVRSQSQNPQIVKNNDFYTSIFATLNMDCADLGNSLQATGRNDFFSGSTIQWTPDEVGNMRDETYKNLMIAQFLLGHRSKITQSVSRSEVNRLLQSCENIGRNRKMATKEQDFIVSTFPSCARYHLPEGYKTMTVLPLLDDALSQMATGDLFLPEARGRTARSEIYIPSRIPGGLLNAVAINTAYWSLAHGLHKKHYADSRDIFFTFGWSEVSLLERKGEIPLISVGTSERGIAKRLLDFEAWAKGLGEQEVRMMISTLETPSQSKAYELIRGSDIPSNESGPTKLWQPDKNHLLALVCEVMNLDIEVCRQNDADLVFVKRDSDPQWIELGNFTPQYDSVGL
jgi:hypothetical protein